MPATPKIRRSYRGAPVSAALGGSGVTSATATSVTLSSSPSTWPTGKFFVVVAPGTSSEEKMCVTLSGSTLTVVDPNVASTSASVNGRGVDNTTARSSIAVGSVVYPVATAIDFDEANSLTSTYANQGGIVYMGDPSFTQLGIGTAAQVLRVNAGATAPEWGQVATAGIADSAVTSAKIADDTIMNADINSAAAISLSKLATGALPTAITVASANIVDGTIVAGDIANTTITAAKLVAAVTEALNPTGAVLPYAGTTAPSGWLLCYGQAVSRTTYADLFTVLSTTYGSGDGSTTFNVPDLRGRVPAGQDDMGGTSANRLTNPAATTGGIDGDVLGGTGGSETHTLTSAQMPSHTHVLDLSSSTGSGETATQGGDVTRGLQTTFVGGSTAHNNVQPTIILNYIIKT